MFDIALRPLKDGIFDNVTNLVPTSVSPTQVTVAAFLSGVACCIAAARASPTLAVSLWIFNRSLDCLDGAVARKRQQSSDLGGFLDLLGDFIVYSAIPICCTIGHNTVTSTPDWTSIQRQWLAVAVVESTFHINNFILFFLAALMEKEKAKSAGQGQPGSESTKTKELTSLSMKPALVEGFESGLAFTLMLAIPAWTEALCWVLSAGVIVGIVQRTQNAIFALNKVA